jgi:predicted DNA-binding transcriptional regulator YafY
VDKNFARLLDTLAILQRRQRLSTTEVRERLAARGHQVSARTVQRDLEDLAREQPIECDALSKPYTWRWRDGAARISLPSMDWPEAISFHLLQTYLDGVLPASVKDGIEPYLSEAKRKLSQRFDQLPLRRWPDRVRIVHQGPPQMAPKVARSVHEAFLEAVLLGQRLSIRYRSFEAAVPKSYVISPLGLVQHGGVFYAPVRFGDHANVRTVALHRVQRAQVLDEPSGIEDFDLEAWLADGALGFGGQELIQLHLRVFEGMGDRLQESPLSSDQKIDALEDGSHRVTATVRDTVQLRRWLLSLGPRAEVLSPEPLRQAMRDTFNAAAARY